MDVDLIREYFLENIHEEKDRNTSQFKTYEIDENIYPLVEALWGVHIKTNYSCSGVIQDHYPEPAIDKFILQFDNERVTEFFNETAYLDSPYISIFFKNTEKQELLNDPNIIELKKLLSGWSIEFGSIKGGHVKMVSKYNGNNKKTVDNYDDHNISELKVISDRIIDKFDKDDFKKYNYLIYD